MTPTRTRRRGGDVMAIWSDEMHDRVDQIARSFRGPWWVEADDLRQEIYANLCRYQRRTGETEITNVLLSFMADNQIRHYLRTHWRQKHRVSLGDEPSGDERPDADAVLDVRDAIERVGGAAAALVKARWVEHRSFEDLASASGKTTIAIQHRQRTAYALLRGGLGESYGPAAMRPWPRNARRKRRARRAGSNWKPCGPIPNQRKEE